MYSKSYILENIEEFHRHNPLYDEMEGRLCYPVYFNVGKRGWFLYFGEYDTWPHRVHTSFVKDVVYTDDSVIVTTQNTRYTFKEIKKEG